MQETYQDIINYIRNSPVMATTTTVLISGAVYAIGSYIVKNCARINNSRKSKQSELEKRINRLKGSDE